MSNHGPRYNNFLLRWIVTHNLDNIDAHSWNSLRAPRRPTGRIGH